MLTSTATSSPASSPSSDFSSPLTQGADFGPPLRHLSDSSRGKRQVKRLPLPAAESSWRMALGSKSRRCPNQSAIVLKLCIAGLSEPLPSARLVEAPYVVLIGRSSAARRVARTVAGGGEVTDFFHPKQVHCIADTPRIAFMLKRLHQKTKCNLTTKKFRD